MTRKVDSARPAVRQRLAAWWRRHIVDNGPPGDTSRPDALDRIGRFLGP